MVRQLSDRLKFEIAKDDVYDYIRRLAYRYPPEEALKLFYDLLWDRVTPALPTARSALTTVVEDARFKQIEGLHFLNRSYYSICNPWHLDGEMMPYLRRLIDHLGTLPAPAAQNPTTELLRERLKDFGSGEYGDCLRRQMRLGGYATYREEHREFRGIVADYLPDYFCLYRSATRTPDIEQLERDAYSNPEHSGTGAKQLNKLRETYEAVYRYRELRHQGATGLVNPSRLQVPDFERGLDYYYPHRHNSFSQQAQTHTQQRRVYQRYANYRPHVKTYLMDAIEPFPARTKERIAESIRKAMARIEDDAQLEAITTKNLFLRLLDAVLLPEYNTSHTLRLERWVSDASPLDFAGMLLSLVLACPMIRFSLEKKLGYLYRAFEYKTIEAAQWVVELFEHINLSLVMNARQIGYFPLLDPPSRLD
ncbi:MAG: hypothetical protein ACFCVD_06535 [Nodosilinea sp.]